MSKEYRVLPLCMPNPDEKPIPKNMIYKLCMNGLIDPLPEDRCIAWLVMLGVYPSNPNEWLAERDVILNNYVEFKALYKMDHWHKQVLPKPSLITPRDLEVQNQDLMMAIYKDIDRTVRQFQYFPPAEAPDGMDLDDERLFINEHMRRAERILYIFGSINCFYAYMQGFNDLVAPLFYVFLKGKEVFYDNLDLVEAVTFHCLQRLVTACGLKEFYEVTNQRDTIIKKMKTYETILAKHDPKIAHHLVEKLQIDSFGYCYRWLILLFSQELALPQLCTLWDVIFAHQPYAIDFAFYVSAAKIIVMKDQLKEAKTMGAALKLLHNEKDIDVHALIKVANDMWEKDKKKRKLSLTVEG